jgi:arginase family enzyme
MADGTSDQAAREVAGETRFLGLSPLDRESAENADVVLFGVPSNAGSEGRKGANDGPKHVRRQS